MKKVFLEDLPKKEGVGVNKGRQVIDWIKSIGKCINFTYENIEGEVKIVDYDGKYLHIKYSDREIFKIVTGSFQNCQLGKLLGKCTDEFKVKIGQIFKDDNRDLIIIDREYRQKTNNEGKKQNWKYYKYKCLKCGYDEGWLTEGDLFNNRGCSVCKGLTVVKGINDISTTAPWMVKYFQGGYDEAKLYTKVSQKKIYPICPECGRIKSKAIKIGDIYQEHSIFCTCGDGMSYPNKFMFGLLEQLKINFISEHSPEWIKPRRYDFYFELDNKEYIIEMDGSLGHGKDNTMNGQSKEESKSIDDYKDKLAKEHGVKVIRIGSEVSELEYIKNNVLNSELINILRLSDISWLKCHEFACKSLVKIVCEIKRDNPSYTTTDIGLIMNLNRTTVLNYLKKGSNIWDWINYNPQEEIKNSTIKMGKANGKPIQIFKNGELLGIFESCAELERQGEKLFGVKLFSSEISKICNNKYPHSQYKGYTFKYVN